MQAAADAKVKFVVLDRPNPNTGLVVDGPLADKSHQGFTAFGPLPLQAIPLPELSQGSCTRIQSGELSWRRQRLQRPG